METRNLFLIKGFSIPTPLNLLENRAKNEDQNKKRSRELDMSLNLTPSLIKSLSLGITLSSSRNLEFESL